MSFSESTCSTNWEAWTTVGTIAIAIGTGFLAYIAWRTAQYAKQQLDDFRNESRVKHLNDLVVQFESEPMASYRRKLGALRAPSGVLVPLDLNNPPHELHDVMYFFEHMGYLLDGKYLDLEGVFVEFHYWILNVWADAKRLVKSEQAEEPIYYELFEKMVNRLLEHNRPRTGQTDLPSDDDIAYFYIEESHRPTGSPIPKQKRPRRTT